MIEYLRKNGAKIGNNVYIGSGFYIDQSFERLLCIDDDVVIAANVSIILHDSSMNNLFGLPVRFGKVIIGKNAYVGAGTTILPGVTIGENTLIGARSLVIKSIPSNKLAYGSPAEVICDIDDYVKKYQRSLNDANGFIYWDILPWRYRVEEMSCEDESWKFNDFIFANRERVYPDARSEVAASDPDVYRYMAFGWLDVEDLPPKARLFDHISLTYMKKPGPAKFLKINFFSQHDTMVVVSIDRKDAWSYQLKADIRDVIAVPLEDVIGERVIEIMMKQADIIPYTPDEKKSPSGRIAVERVWIE